MLGFVEGKIISKNFESSHLTLLCEKVGYEITVSKRLFEKHSLSENVSLWLHTHVREDQLTLFGFPSEIEKNLFRVLLSVSGLGPKTALSLLSEHGSERLCQFVLKKDATSVSSAPGVGKKLAERIILELAPKLEKLSWLAQITAKSETNAQTKKPEPADELREDLTSALQNLGYQLAQIRPILDRVLEREVQAFEVCLKAALREMSHHAN